MSGLGLAPLGTSTLGFGEADEATAPPADLPEGSNFLDPRTGDYTIADDGAIKRMPTARHRVMMLLKTAKGSAAYERAIGLEMPKKIDQRFRQKAEQAVREALTPLQNDIRIDSIDVKVLPNGRADINVSFTDLTTANSDTVTV